MENMTLLNIANACGGRYIGDETLKDETITMATIDSRQIEKDGLFIAVKGEKTDGHNYINDVYQKGALCVISEKELDTDKPYILVESSLMALKDIAEFYRENLQITVIGITGSVGKTSTKEMVASVLETKYKVLKTEGNFNNEIGLPLTILKIRKEHEVAVVEMGISDFGEMHRLSKIAKPDVCILTNIGTCHLENLIDRDGVLKAKTEIFDYSCENGYIVLNGDDDKLITIKDVNGIKPVYVGFSKENTIYANNLKDEGLVGTEFDIVDGKYSIKARVNIPGVHMVNNALTAYAVGKILELSDEEIVKGIAALKPVGGRNNIITTKYLTIIDDCYNANPVSMKASIDVLDKATTRKVAILGDMFELGENESLLHYEVGKYLATKQIDLLITAGTLAKNIAKAVKENLKIDVLMYDTRDELLEDLSKHLKANDTVLIKASHGMHFDKIVEDLKCYQ